MITRTGWLRAVTAACAALLLASCSGDSGPKAGGPKPTTSSQRASIITAAPQQTGIPECEKPKEVPFPDWVPDDLPLPEGIYAYKNLPPVGGYQRSLFVLDEGTRQLIKLVLREWPKAGYALGRGDAEPGEVEDDFRKPPAVGAFKANDVYCTPGYTVMYLIWAAKGPKSFQALPTPTSSGSPLEPK